MKIKSDQRQIIEELLDLRNEELPLTKGNRRKLFEAIRREAGFGRREAFLPPSALRKLTALNEGLFIKYRNIRKNKKRSTSSNEQQEVKGSNTDVILAAIDLLYAHYKSGERKDLHKMNKRMLYEEVRGLHKEGYSDHEIEDILHYRPSEALYGIEVITIDTIRLITRRKK